MPAPDTTIRDAIAQIESTLRLAASEAATSLPMTRVLNEWEVVFLLGALLRGSSVRLYEGSDIFPDAILEVVGPSSTILVRTELEYRASRFNHDIAGCDLVICWRDDIGRLGHLPIIALYDLLPELDGESDALQIVHEEMDPVLRSIFMTIQEWLHARKFVPKGTGSTTTTSTVTFNAHISGKAQSLCSLQYYNHNGYLQFKWYKAALRLLGCEQEFQHIHGGFQSRLLQSNANAETQDEYRFNLQPADAIHLHELLNSLSRLQLTVDPN
ncbi:MAG: hypothetical protein KDA37_10360 [Planctomycetales bacterium]|nr:hypothetical protein [Planctomycetales bacterium]